jgi:Zn-dependent M28 family amino/carboxypeptidase
MFIHRSSDCGPSVWAGRRDVAGLAELRFWVEEISVPRHFYRESNGNRRVALWILEMLGGWGYEVVFQGEARNVVAVPRGLSGAAVLVGAHYDSVPGCPGADDNASAVAAMLAAARACGGRGRVVFAAFNREEDGLLGSREFVREGLPAMRWKVREAHILEMVGYASDADGSQRVPDGLPVRLPSVGNFLGLLANGESVRMLRHVLANARGSKDGLEVLGLEVRLGIERLLPVLRRSDHVPFWEAGIPAVMWTDTSEFRNPHYHQVSDTPDTLDFVFLRKVAALLESCLGAGE